ncbi:MAG: type II toxin-antitoxin system HicA family toxin [Rhodobacterales bacterium]|nr:type II toxin-antitoxin system HicA family toxin [Rhodobacterales bacterium]
MDSRTLIKRLEADGWFMVAQKGLAPAVQAPGEKGRVTVPHPKRDLARGTVKSIERQSGLKLL